MTTNNTKGVVAILADEKALAGAHDIQFMGNDKVVVCGKGFTLRGPSRSGRMPYPPGSGGSLAVIDIADPTVPKVLWTKDMSPMLEDAETLLVNDDGRVLLGSMGLHGFICGDDGVLHQCGESINRESLASVNGMTVVDGLVASAGKVGWVGLSRIVPRGVELVTERNVRVLDGLEAPHDVAEWMGKLVCVSPQGFGDAPGRLALYGILDNRGDARNGEAWSLLDRVESTNLAGANRVAVRGDGIAVVGCSIKRSSRSAGVRGGIATVDLNRGKVVDWRYFCEDAGPNGLTLVGDVAVLAGGQSVQIVEVDSLGMINERTSFFLPSAFVGGEDDAHDLVYRDGVLFVTAQNSHAMVVVDVGSL